MQITKPFKPTIIKLPTVFGFVQTQHVYTICIFKEVEQFLKTMVD